MAAELNTITQTLTWTSGKRAPTADLHDLKLVVYASRPGWTRLVACFASYNPKRGWSIEGTDNATVHWYTRLQAPKPPT